MAELLGERRRLFGNCRSRAGARSGPGSHGCPCAPRPIITASAPERSSARTAFSNEVMSPLTTRGIEIASLTARTAAQSASPL